MAIGWPVEHAATRTLSPFHRLGWWTDSAGGEAAPGRSRNHHGCAVPLYLPAREGRRVPGDAAALRRPRAATSFVIGRNPAAAGAASVQALAGDLAAPDWATRLAAAETLARLTRAAATREAARDALARPARRGAGFQSPRRAAEGAGAAGRAAATPDSAARAAPAGTRLDPGCPRCCHPRRPRPSVTRLRPGRCAMAAACYGWRGAASCSMSGSCR